MMSNGARCVPCSACIRDGSDSSLHISDWDDYFLEIAMTVARKSKDTTCLVGAVIVSPDSLVLATGYNGFPLGVHDDIKLLEEKQEKLARICHAETNAIFNAVRAGVSVLGCTMYVNKFPCFTCLNAIVQSGLKTVCTQDFEYWKHDRNDPEHRLKRELLDQVDLEIRAPNHPDFAPLKEFIRKPGTSMPNRKTAESGSADVRLGG
jgi:dCMP deaminase